MLYTHTIKSFEAHQRIDKFLSQQAYFQVIGRSGCVTLVQDSSITINNKTVKPNYVLKSGDTISLNKQIIQKSTNIEPNKSLNIKIIFQNEHFVVIDKPAGIRMHPDTQDSTDTIVNWAMAYFPEIKTVGEDPMRPGIVHRLDKDTSGLCIIAKTQGAFTKLKEAFQSRKVQKTYVAIVFGNIKPQQGIIEKPIARSMALNKQIALDANTKSRGKVRDAITHYQVIQSFPNYDFVEVIPKTGRMHQIRAHFFSIGHPIVGDKRYFFKQHKRKIPDYITRHLLHAKRLQFNLFEEDFDISSSLPQDLQQFLDQQSQNL